MKTPKEKAKELIDEFSPYVDWNDLQNDCTNRGWRIRNAKKCALIAVDEILKIGNVIISYNVTDYWQEVKQEIELL